MTEIEIATTLANHENRLKVSEKRIETLEKKTDRIENLTLSVHSLAQSVETMAKEQIEYRDKQNELAKRILNVEQAPAKGKAKKYDETLAWILQCSISAILGFLFAYFGLGI